jgi:hypothetical protein
MKAAAHSHGNMVRRHSVVTIDTGNLCHAATHGYIIFPDKLMSGTVSSSEEVLKSGLPALNTKEKGASLEWSRGR